MTARDAGNPTLFTIGHSTHSAEALIGLLKRHGITAVADLRSTPFSRRNPQFNRSKLEAELEANGIAYHFLGKELGARAKDARFYRDGRVDYDLLGASELFRSGLERLRADAQRARLAILCAEKEPLDCHRAILVSRRLKDLRVSVRHILADGSLEEHADTEERLLKLTGTEPPPLLSSAEDRSAALGQAYQIRARAIAHPRPASRAARSACR